MSDRIPGPYLFVECRCGHSQTIYEQADDPSWISDITLEDTPRMRCKSCGERGQILLLRKGWELADGWSSSN